MGKIILIIGIAALLLISGCIESKYKECNLENYGFLTNATMDISSWEVIQNRCCFDYNKHSGFNEIDCTDLIPK